MTWNDFDQIIPYVAMALGTGLIVTGAMDLRRAIRHSKKVRETATKYRPQFISHLENLENAIRTQDYHLASNLIDNTEAIKSMAEKECKNLLSSRYVSSDKELSDALNKLEMLADSGPYVITLLSK